VLGTGGGDCRLSEARTFLGALKPSSQQHPCKCQAPGLHTYPSGAWHFWQVSEARTFLSALRPSSQQHPCKCQAPGLSGCSKV